jgi:ABC-type polysaccharide/polyol phosphate transport system ATPase subunit
MEYSIEARDLGKSFLVPERKVETIRERVATGRLRPKVDLMPALKSISFGIRPGEFFGVVGRNGSGKSTLLKLMAGIYRADSGTVTARGKVAPIIELGVGFNTELSAADNVLVNGVMMGLSESEARRRMFRIIEFAGLQRFVGLKLKNYSSGMRVRLAFSIMVHIDADVMLIDEVLAVGDGAFKAQSEAAMRELHASGRTIVLVTHSMSVIKRLCDRAMLLERGVIDTIGDPAEVVDRYNEIVGQRLGASRQPAAAPAPAPEPKAPPSRARRGRRGSPSRVS